jgi:Mrp family chromosome partitioning ATPase
VRVPLTSDIALAHGAGRILATMVEDAILVVNGGFTPRELAQQAQLHIRDVGAHLIGVVLNDIDLRRNGYHYGFSQCGG